MAPALLLRRPAWSARLPAVRIDSAHGSGLGASCFRPGSTAGRGRGQVNGMVVGTFEMKPPIGSKYRAIQVRNHSSLPRIFNSDRPHRSGGRVRASF